MEIIIKADVRQCVINGDTKALFHKWCDRSDILQPSCLIGGHNGGVLKYTTALVELENGSIKEVTPSQVEFKDDLFEEHYCCDKLGAEGTV